MIDLDMILGVRTRVVWEEKFSEGGGESSLKFSGITSESSCGKIVGLGKEDKDKLSGTAKLMTNKNGKEEDKEDEGI